MLDKHKMICGKPSSAVIEFPPDGQNLTFTKTEFNFKRIYNGYADFESVVEKTKKNLDCTKCAESKFNGTCKHSYSIDTEIHKPLL